MRFGLDEDIINTINQIFEANSKVDKAIVFGSRAKGNYRPDSDIDIAVKGFDLTLDDILKMQVAFEEKGIEYKIDVIDYSSIKEKALVDHIDRVGIEMYSRWKECKLGELCTDINYGYTASANDSPIGPKFLRITDIVPRRVNWETVPYCEMNEKDHEKYKLEKGDIVIARTGATTGYNHTFKDEVDAVFASYLIRYRIDKKRANPFFIEYALKSEIWTGFVEGIIGGSAQPGANAKMFGEFKLFIPPLQEQAEISEILSSLDNKLDLLHRQNKTLEQLAETLFRQWFVEEAEDTWEEDVLEKYVSFDPREKIDRSRQYQFFEMKCLSNVDMNISDGIDRSVSSASSFRNFDTLLAKITPCLENGKTGFVMHLGDDEVARGSTEFIVMRSKGLVSPYWIYCLARDNDFREKAIQSMTGTSGRQRVQIDLLKNIRVKMDTKKMKEFHEVVSAYFFKIKSNQIQIGTLTQLRDALLPKLMTGEVRVAI